MTDRLHFTITRTKQDHIRAHRAYITRSKIFKTIWALWTVFVALIVLVQIAKFIDDPGGTVHWKGAASLVAIYLIWGALIYLISPAMVARSVRVPVAPSQVLVDNSGFEDGNSLMCIRADWKMFPAALETKSYFFLFRGRAGYRFYPKKQMGDQVIGRFREIIRKNVPKAKLAKEKREFKNNAEVGSEIGEEFSHSSMFTSAPERDSPRALSFDVILTKDDYKRMFRYNVLRSKTERIAIGVLLLFMLYFNYVNILDIFGGENIYGALYQIGVNTSLIMALIFFLYYIYPVIVARSAPDVGIEMKINVDNAGILVIGNVVKCRIAWEYVVSALETAEDFMLRAGGGFFAYPKRCLQSGDEIDRFRALMRDNVPNAKLMDS